MRARANIETIDQEISGTILISSFVSPDPEALARRAPAQAGLTLIEDPEAKDAAVDRDREAHGSAASTSSCSTRAGFIPAPTA